MTPSKPYLIRALHEWIVDNECTPHMLVAVDLPGVQVPQGFAENGQLVLNISPFAVRNLQLDNSHVSFEARFGGVAQLVSVPMPAIMAIYARENGQGMFFEPQEQPAQQSEQQHTAEAEPQPEQQAEAKKTTRPGLKLIK